MPNMYKGGKMRRCVGGGGGGEPGLHTWDPAHWGTQPTALLFHSFLVTDKIIEELLSMFEMGVGGTGRAMAIGPHYSYSDCG